MRLVDQFAAGTPGASPEALAYQISATREFLRDLPQQDAEVSTLQEIVRVAGAAQESDDRRMLIPPLLAFAFWLEEELRLDEALDVLDTTLSLSDGEEREEELATCLQRGRILRLCGRLDEARESYTEAGRMAARLGDSHSLLLSRIGRGIVLQRLGNLPESERVLREVIADAQLVGDTDAEARALHDLSATLYAAGRIREAIPPVFRAHELYDRPLHRTRALSDTGLLLKELGYHTAAKKALSIVLAQDPSKEVRARSVLELLEISAIFGDRVSFERWRRCLGEDYSDLPVDEQIDYHMKLGSGLARFGLIGPAQEQASKAIALADRYRLGERLFKAEHLLAEIRENRIEEPVDAEPAYDQVDDAPELRQTLSSLHALTAHG